MSTHIPPVPPAGRSDKGPNETAGQKGEISGERSMANRNPDKIGQQGNSKINTTNQGYQQDR